MEPALATEFQAQWDPAADDPAVEGYELRYGPDPNPETFDRSVIANGAGTNTVSFSEEIPGTYYAAVRSCSSCGEESAVFSDFTDEVPFTVESPANQPPVVAEPEDQSNIEGTDVTVQIKATDPDEGPSSLRYAAATPLPPDLSIDDQSGLISGTLASDSAGDYNVIVRVSDGSDDVLVDFNWIVSAANQPPDVDEPEGQSNDEDTDVTVQVKATDPDEGPYPLWYTAEGLPPGLSINNEDGTISGTLASGSASGSPYTVIVSVSDGPDETSVSFEWNVLAASNPPPTENPPPPELIAAYSFDEAEGDVAADSSGNDNDGLIVGATWTTEGQSGAGAALSFDGVDDWVTVSDADSLDLQNGMTLEAWIFPTASEPAWSAVITKERPDGLIYSLYANSDAPNPSTYIWATSSEQGAHGGSGLPLNTWTHLASTFDGSNLKLYVNGTQVSSELVTGPIGVSDGVLRIGGNAVWGEYFTGLIDDIRIYNRALAAAEIQTDMDAPVDATSPDLGENHPPIVVKPDDQSSIEGREVTLEITAGDRDGDVLKFSASNLPAGLIIDEDTGTISGTLESGSADGSPYTVKVSVSDGPDETSVSFEWVVRNWWSRHWHWRWW